MGTLSDFLERRPTSGWPTTWEVTGLRTQFVCQSTLYFNCDGGGRHRGGNEKEGAGANYDEQVGAKSD